MILHDTWVATRWQTQQLLKRAKILVYARWGDAQIAPEFCAFSGEQELLNLTVD